MRTLFTYNIRHYCEYMYNINKKKNMSELLQVTEIRTDIDCV